MTTGLHSFAARLREFISRCSSPHVPRVSSCSQPGSSDTGFNLFALELFALQFASNAPYRRLCESRGVKPGSIAHWSHIPAVPASAFKELELTCLAPGERTRVFHSSGTTEQRPSRHFHNAESLALYEASLWPWFQQHVLADVGQAFQSAGSPDSSLATNVGVPVRCSEELATGKVAEPADRNVRPTPAGHWQLAILTPPPAAAPHSSLVHMFETVRRNSGAGESAFLGDGVADGVWTLALGRAGAAIHSAVAAGRPLVLLGTAFNFVHLIDGLAERSIEFQLPPGSVVMETGGYKGRSREMPKDALHQFITRSLGVPRSHILCEYGMSEISSQAYDGMSDGWRVTSDVNATRNTQHATRSFTFPPWSRAQIISPETGREVNDGETGLIRIFDLANAFSVLAVQTEDLAIRRGDGFELIGRATATEPRGCSLMTT